MTDVMMHRIAFLVEVGSSQHQAAMIADTDMANVVVGSHALENPRGSRTANADSCVIHEGCEVDSRHSGDRMVDHGCTCLCLDLGHLYASVESLCLSSADAQRGTLCRLGPGILPDVSDLAVTATVVVLIFDMALVNVSGWVNAACASCDGIRLRSHVYLFQSRNDYRAKVAVNEGVYACLRAEEKDADDVDGGACLLCGD